VVSELYPISEKTTALLSKPLKKGTPRFSLTGLMLGIP